MNSALNQILTLEPSRCMVEGLHLLQGLERSLLEHQALEQLLQAYRVELRLLWMYDHVPSLHPGPNLDLLQRRLHVQRQIQRLSQD